MIFTWKGDRPRVRQNSFKCNESKHVIIRSIHPSKYTNATAYTHRVNTHLTSILKFQCIKNKLRQTLNA